MRRQHTLLALAFAAQIFEKSPSISARVNETASRHFDPSQFYMPTRSHRVKNKIARKRN